jgi:hypothetical protein
MMRGTINIKYIENICYIIIRLKCCYEADKIRRTTWTLEHAMWCEHSFNWHNAYVKPSTSCCKSFLAQDPSPWVSLHITSSPIGWILMKFDIGKLSKMCRENWSIFKMKQNIWHVMCRPSGVCCCCCWQHHFAIKFFKWNVKSRCGIAEQVLILWNVLT